MRLISVLASVALLASPAPARAALSSSLPINLDGAFSDWAGNPAEVTDPTGDAGGSGVDFTRVGLANDDTRLFLFFDTTVEIQPDEGHDVRFALDTDDNPATGFSIGGIGAELVWSLGQRNGTFYLGGGSAAASHPQLGLGIAPTVSDTQFEVGILRSTSSGGTPLFSASPIRVVVYDSPGGDQAGASLQYVFSSDPQPVPPLGLSRFTESDVRIGSYNIQNDGLFDTDPSREAAIERLLQAIDADVWIFTEVWNHDAAQVENRIEAILPTGVEATWAAYKPQNGTVVVSRLPIRHHVALLVDARPMLDSDLLVVGNHWSCCTADANRQDQADALIQNLKSAREPGGILDLASDTPIVAGGDFNLVGWRRQLETLATGDIDDEATYGPDSPPDWDGSDFDLVPARHPDARLTYTWRNDGSSFYPGRLDWLAYTGSVVDLQNHFVLDTRSMSPGNLLASGLNAGDSGLASDHNMLVADFAPLSPVAVAPGPSSRVLTLGHVRPNPFAGSVTLTLTLTQDTPLTVQLYDARGGKLRTLVDEEDAEAGSRVVVWDGVLADGTPAPPGVYFLTARAAGERAIRRIVRIR
jgi:endonuclease/exonuclease/phosphatase family metal-dependent hydrolase